MIFPAGHTRRDYLTVIALDAGYDGYYTVEDNNPDEFYFYMVPPQIWIALIHKIDALISFIAAGLITGSKYL